MKILPMSYSMPKVSFGAKKTLYTDFDGTYFPFKRWQIREDYKDSFSRMYQPFDSFKKSDDEFNIIVTTGRTKNDFLQTQQKITDEGLEYCMPDGLISTNGANTFIINKNGSKVEAIDTTNLGEQFNIADKAIEIARKANPDARIFECEINGKESEYGEGSLEHYLDSLPHGDDKQKYVSIVRDGQYNCEMLFSKGADDDTTADNIQSFIKEQNLPFTIEHYENSPFTTGIEYNFLNEKSYVNANLILLKYKGKNGIPDKFDIIQRKVREAIVNRNGDIIICAGDGFNDEKMLNPLNYIGLMGLGSRDKKSDEELLSDEKVIEGLKVMPFRAIITGDDPALDNLREMAAKLHEKGVNILTVAPDPKTDYAKAVKDILDEANS